MALLDFNKEEVHVTLWALKASRYQIEDNILSATAHGDVELEKAETKALTSADAAIEKLSVAFNELREKVEVDCYE